MPGSLYPAISVCMAVDSGTQVDRERHSVPIVVSRLVYQAEHMRQGTALSVSSLTCPIPVPQTTSPHTPHAWRGGLHLGAVPAHTPEWCRRKSMNSMELPSYTSL